MGTAHTFLHTWPMHMHTKKERKREGEYKNEGLNKMKEKGREREKGKRERRKRGKEGNRENGKPGKTKSPQIAVLWRGTEWGAELLRPFAATGTSI